MLHRKTLQIGVHQEREAIGTAAVEAVSLRGSAAAWLLRLQELRTLVSAGAHGYDTMGKRWGVLMCVAARSQGDAQSLALSGREA
jgi:hypothetical protein